MPFLADAQKSTPRSDFHKAIYAIRGIGTTRGMACAVDFAKKDPGQPRQDNRTGSVCLVTWSGCIVEHKSVKVDRYSRKNMGDYQLRISNVIKTKNFSFLTVMGEKKECPKSLSVKYLKNEEQTTNFMVYTIPPSKKLKELTLQYNHNTKKHDLIISEKRHDFSLLGSPIIMNEKNEEYFVGVLKENDTGEPIPFFIAEEEVETSILAAGRTPSEGFDSLPRKETSRDSNLTEEDLGASCSNTTQETDQDETSILAAGRTPSEGFDSSPGKETSRDSNLTEKELGASCSNTTQETDQDGAGESNYLPIEIEETSQVSPADDFHLKQHLRKNTEDALSCTDGQEKQEEQAGISPYSSPIMQESNQVKQPTCMKRPISKVPNVALVSQLGGVEHRPTTESLTGFYRRLSDLPRSVRQFVGRNQEINDIKKYVGPNPENDCRCVLIHGAVGMGKTATAINAANEIRDNKDNTAVVYINCNYVSSLDDLAGKISKQLHHIPFNEPIEEVKRWLINEQNLFTILLLDNFQFLLPMSANGQANCMQLELRRIDRTESLKITTFITEIVTASAKVKLLVTSSEIVAFHETGQQLIRLHALEKDHSFELLKITYGNSIQVEKEIAYKIADFCDGIPLALISLASSYDHPPDLVQMMTNANPKERYEKFIEIPFADESKKIDFCLDTSFSRLDQNLRDTLISLMLFRGHFTMSRAEQVFRSKELESRILKLAQRSFLEQNRLGPTAPCWYSLLTVQKLYCQNKALEERFREVYHGARKLFIEHFLAFLEETFKKFLSTEALQAIDEFRQEEENIMQLLDWFKSGTMDEEQILRCIDVFNKVGELLAKMMGKKRFEAAFNMLKDKCRNIGDRRRLSECLTSLGIKEVFDCFFSPRQSDEAAETAKSHLVEADRIQTDLQINTGNSRAQCLAKSGRCLAKLGQFREGKEKIEQAIEIRKSHGDEDSVMLGATYNDFAVALSLEAAHQPQERANELLQKAVELRKDRTLPIYREKLGEHPFTATILNSLSRNYRTLRDFENAKRYSEEALKIRSDFLGEHMETAFSLFDLAMVLKEKEELEAAKTNLEKCEAMQKKVLDENNMDLLSTKQELEDVRNRLAELGNIQENMQLEP